MTISHSDELQFLLKYNAIFRKHRKVMNEIIDAVQWGHYEQAFEIFEELPQEDQIVLNRAWTKGGFFTPQERDIAVKGVDKTSGWSIWDYRICKPTE